ncbi:hypothetical protein HK414_23865 [Ramlibacter terrae]|uniref:Peptidase M48 domain-containing protein n=1 Tax=Ramlibacter terrae TaxID=2732511 RepID=A0ABX6P5G3_9BURK|nr:hypothetical protein HK414_23865 [Ramlibacter terrae]
MQAWAGCAITAPPVQAAPRATYEGVPVPPQFHDALARVMRVARLPAGVRVELVGSHRVHSASVHASGTIRLSSRLWREGHALDAEEAAAVIAHEVAHRNCRT